MKLKKRGKDRAMKINMQRMSRGRVSKEVEVKPSERKEKFQETRNPGNYPLC